MSENHGMDLERRDDASYPCRVPEDPATVGNRDLRIADEPEEEDESGPEDDEEESDTNEEEDDEEVEELDVH